MTDEEKQSGNIERTFACPQQLYNDNEYTVTITPTETWGVGDGDRQPVAGEAVSIASNSYESEGNILLTFTLVAYNLETQAEGFNLEIRFVDDDPK